MEKLSAITSNGELIMGSGSKTEDPYDRISLLHFIKKCGKHKDLHRGRRIHSHILHRGLFHKDMYIHTALISMYSKCGSLKESQQVFDEILVRNVVCWNALISGYAQQGYGNDALKWFMSMQEEGHPPDVVTFTCMFKACGSIKSVGKGEDMHARIRKQGLLTHNTVLGNALVHMYAKCGMIKKALEVFNEILIRDVASWNALINGYANHGFGEKALECFAQMQVEGTSPDSITFACVLNACGSLGLIEKGEKIHAEVASKGLLSDNVVLGNAIVGMYVKCGVLEKAREVFDELPVRNAITWNALLSGYAQHRLGDEALSFFALMQDEGFLPNVVTFLCALSACISIGSLEKGEEIHVEIKKKDGLLENNASLGNALVDMYTKCGAIKKAQEVFDGLSVKDVISWTSLISGYTIHGLSEEALKCYAKMQDEGIMPDVVTYACVLKACGSIGSVDKGEEIHGEVHNNGLLKDNIMLGNALVDMYSKFGMLEKAYRVFDDLPFYDVVSWNVLLSGYAQLCEVKKAFISFNKMKSEGLMPDAVTFAVLLTACSHAGLIQDGQTYFDIMTDVYCLNPTLEHYICMVHLFSQAGHFDKALKVIEKVAASDRLKLLLPFLGACQKWVNVELGRWTFEQSVHLDKSNAAAFIGMSNIYAASQLLAF